LDPASRYFDIVRAITIRKFNHCNSGCSIILDSIKILDFNKLFTGLSIYTSLYIGRNNQG